MKKQHLLLALALIYLSSQVWLLAAVGKDLELILLSLGAFIALSAIILVSGEIALGRPVVESVSMRRAQQSHETQHKMIEEGYAIDKEFLQKNRFEFPHAREKYSAPNGTVSSEPMVEPEANETSIEKLRKGLVAQAPMFGGMDKLSETLAKMDDSKVLKMLKQFGYQEITASQVRNLVDELVSVKNDEPKASNGKEIYRIKTSLNTVDFYDYIKRCMSGNDMESKREAPTIMGMDILEQASSAVNSNPARAMARMRGVHKGGGVRKCDTCQHYQNHAMLCAKISLEVEHNDVCDGWTANVAYQAFK